MNESFDTLLGTPQARAVASLRELVKTVPMYALAEFASESPNAPPFVTLELNYFGTKVLVGKESDDATVQAALNDALAKKRDAYAAAIKNAPNPRVEQFDGEAGDHVSQCALTATQQAQKLYAAATATSPTCPIRFVFEFNGVVIDFNPYEDAELVASRTMAAIQARAQRYEKSAEYAAQEAKSAQEVSNLQELERSLRESVTDAVKKPLADIVEFVRKYGDCADRTGVTTNPQEIVIAFMQAGFAPNAFTGPEYKNSPLSPLETRTRYWIGQFLDMLPRKQGLPGIFFSMGEELSKSYLEKATA